MGLMREEPPHGLGMLPWEWITDSTRYCRIPTMYDSPKDAMERTAEEYRRHLWAQQPRRVEVWAESDSVSGILDEVTRGLGVGLFSCRGQASKTFAQSSAEEYRYAGKPVTILYVGDWDPMGLAIPRSLRERLLRYSRDAVEVDFRRIAVTAGDVRSGELQTHHVNTRDPNYRHFAEECRLIGLGPQTAVEVEALPPAVLRDRLEAAIYDLVEDVDTWNVTIAAEESERELFMRIVEDYFGRTEEAP
jgi:hypothetical protein